MIGWPPPGDNSGPVLRHVMGPAARPGLSNPAPLWYNRRMLLRQHPARPDGPIYFLSDAHIGTGSPEVEADKEKRLLALLDRVEAEASALVILGDLFDFWFEYRHAIPRRGFNVLARLQRLTQGGLPIDFLGGNHDFWVGDFLTAQLGIVAHGEPFEAEAQGRRLFLAHGDGLAPGDLGYRIIRRIFRNPLAIAAYRALHPDFGIPLATTSSKTSRHYTQEAPVVGPELWRTIAAPRFQAGADAVLIGHFHRPIHLESEGRDFIINGDWMTHWSYTVLEKGHFELRGLDREPYPKTNL